MNGHRSLALSGSIRAAPGYTVICNGRTDGSGITQQSDTQSAGYWRHDDGTATPQLISLSDLPTHTGSPAAARTSSGQSSQTDAGMLCSPSPAARFAVPSSLTQTDTETGFFLQFFARTLIHGVK